MRDNNTLVLNQTGGEQQTGGKQHSPTLGRVEHPEINLGGAEFFLPSPPGEHPTGAENFLPLLAPLPPEVGGDTFRLQEWDTHPWADRVTRSVIGWRNPTPAVNPPRSRILWKIGIRTNMISSARNMHKDNDGS